MKLSRLTIGAFGAAAMIATAGCSGGGYGGGVTPPPPGNDVTVSNNTFSPATRTVAVGTTVKWTWANGAVNHNVTFDDGTKSATQNTGTYSRQFNTAGTYNYHCTIHGPSMSGTITVQ